MSDVPYNITDPLSGESVEHKPTPFFPDSEEVQNLLKLFGIDKSRYTEVTITIRAVGPVIITASFIPRVGVANPIDRELP